jgi:hypothetical protein
MNITQERRRVLALGTDFVCMVGEPISVLDPTPPAKALGRYPPGT